MSDLLERLRTRGWRLTPQRRVVAEVLHGDHVHQHLVCIRCNELLDVLPDGEDRLGLSAFEQRGYEILDVKLLFRGVCPACQSVAP